MPANVTTYNPILKRGERWYIEYYIELNGTRKRIRRSTAEDGRDLNQITSEAERIALAESMIRSIKEKITPVEMNPTATLFTQALELAVELKRSNKFRTNKTFSETARWITEYFQRKGWSTLRCSDVSVQHIQSYFDYCITKLKVRNSTYNTRKNNLRSLMGELVQRSYFTENYVSKIKNRPAADPIRRSLSESEYSTIMGYFAEHDRTMLLACVLLGTLAIRPGELRDLRCGAFDFERGVVRFGAATSKNNRNSVITIPDDLVELLRSYNLHKQPDSYFVFGRAKGRHNCTLAPADKPIGLNTLYNRFKVAIEQLKAAGQLGDITGIQFYSLKDSLAIYLLDSGVDVESAMRHFRHRNLEMFQRYAKRLGFINEPVKRLQFKGRIPGVDKKSPVE
jgi:integrase